MADPRSHVRPGQPLAIAAEQINWLNRQMAVSGGFSPAPPFAAHPSALVVPCLVSSTVDGVSVGYVVKITGTGALSIPSGTSGPSSEIAARVHSLTGSVVVPVTLNNYEDAKVQLGVIVGATKFPGIGSPQMVDVCISGMCVARVRPRGVGQFMSAPVKRNSDDTDAKLTGAGESSSCGTHRVLAGLGPADQEGFLQFAAVLM